MTNQDKQPKQTNPAVPPYSHDSTPNMQGKQANSVPPKQAQNLSNSQQAKQPPRQTTPVPPPYSQNLAKERSKSVPLQSQNSTQTVIKTTKENDANINRSIMFATWAGVCVSLIALIASIYTLITSQISSQEAFKVTSTLRVNDVPTEIREFANVTGADPDKRVTGIISVYWKLFLSNNGSKDISIVRHNLLQLKDSNGLRQMNYTGLDQGLYSFESNKIAPLNLPVTISEGSTVAVYLKVGLLMDASVYELVKKEFQGKPLSSVKELEVFLRSKGIDFYGNKIEMLAPGAFQYPSFNQIKEQTFGVSFETARGTKTSGVVSWYTYSGLFNIP